MADQLASIYGTEKDKVNCSFYLKIGACRHGDTCSRKHVKPIFSCTVLVPGAYVSPLGLTPISGLKPDALSIAQNQQSGKRSTAKLSERQLQEHFDMFYEDFFTEVSLKYGVIEEMIVTENMGSHLFGNVYIRFLDEETAEKSKEGINNRWYNGNPLWAELSPVDDFRKASCRQHEARECDRGGMCNYMHVKRVTESLKDELFASQNAYLKSLGRKDMIISNHKRSNHSENESHHHHQSYKSNHRDHRDDEMPRTKDIGHRDKSNSEDRDYYERERRRKRFE